MKKQTVAERMQAFARPIQVNELARMAARLIDFQRDYDVDDRYLAQVQSIAFALNDLDDGRVKFGRNPDPDTLSALNKRLSQIAHAIAREYNAVFEELDQPNSAITPTLAEQSNGHHPNPNPLPVTLNPAKSALKSPSSTLVFRGENITKTYKSRRIAFTLHPISLDLHLGEITTIVGENGNGKTTLLKAIAGLHAINGGRLTYPLIAPKSLHATNTASLDWYQIKQQIAYISQDLPKWRGNVIDNLRFAAAIHGVDPLKIDGLIDLLITRLRLESYRHAHWKELSGGYKMRFALAKALIIRPKLLIIDEPLANLDVNAQITFLDDLRTFAASPRSPMAVLLTSQHLHEVERIADNIIFLRNGEAIYSGATADFGVERAENSFELACESTLDELKNILQTVQPAVRVAQTGYNFIIHTPVSFSRDALLRQLLDHHVAITYFRDISQSTRQLFTETTAEPAVL